ncbi:MAG: hypothetical protein J5533_01550 [Bacteroidales bacterium]|nr:hypothetical protein [Bacteroidales bacterium]
MKTVKYIALAALLCLAACQKPLTPEKPTNYVNLPDGITMKLNDVGEYSVFARYTDALITGAIEFVGNPESFPADYAQNLIVELVYGKDSENLDKIASCTLSDPESASWLTTVPFSAELNGLSDGSEYWFTAKAYYGEDKSIDNPATKFFTFPVGPVDLDLESGTLWASSNMGADFPGLSGDYYAWADTEPQESYYWPFYQWCHWRNPEFALTKYCNFALWGDNGFVDDKTVMDSSDDPAIQINGEGWHTPTLDQWTELNTQAKWTAGLVGEVKGWFVRSKSDPENNRKVIFLPCAGHMEKEELKGENSDGSYWSANVYESTCFQAYSFEFNATTKHSAASSQIRCNGLSIRPVKDK